MIYLVVIILTFYFASRGNLLYENITGVLITPEYRVYTIIYMIILAIFFGYKTFYIYKKEQMPKKYNYSILISVLLMVIGVLSPYQINSNDFLSNIHVYCCMISSISFLIHLFIFFKYNYKYHVIYNYYIKCIEFLALLTIVFTRINGYIEIIFVIIVSAFLHIIENNKFL